MIYGLADVVQQRRLIDQSEAAEGHKRIVTAKLDALLGLCEAAQCRRMQLLDYFGEASGPCGNCDNCLDPPVTWDGTEAARKMLSAIARCEAASGFGFGAQHTIDVLRGARTAKVAQFGHDRLSTFGIGADLDVAEWRSVLRQLVGRQLVQVDLEHYGVLRLMPASRAVLRGERRLELRRPQRSAGRRSGTQRSDRRSSPTGPSSSLRSARTLGAGEATPASGVGDDTSGALHEALRAWRLRISREHGIPAYTVLHNSTLEEITRRRPRSLEELHAIAGIGAAKLVRYGAELLELVERAA